MSEVETQEFLLVKRTGLDCVITNDVVKGSMQEVSCCVVFHNTVTTWVVNFKFVVSSDNKFTFNLNSMKSLSIWCTLNINNTRNSSTRCIWNSTVVCYLSTHFSVEWCLFKDKKSLARIYTIMTSIISNDYAQTTFCSFRFIQELRWFSDVSKSFILHTHRPTFNHASTRTVLLFFHGSFETFMVNLEAFVFS